VHLSGQTIAGYSLEEEVGAGGAAAVYRAYQSQLDRWVAIKVLDVADAGGPAFLARFRAETRAVAALQHPNILSIYDYGEEQGIAYIVMEYVSGGSLARRMHGRPMASDAALALAIPIGDALDYAHGEGIVHRDVKPSNILLARADWPLIVDFGLAGVVDARTRIGQSSAVPTTTYLSPEQVAGEAVDLRTDIYSLGLVLYELVTGHTPFEATSAAEATMARVHKAPVPPREANAAVPEALEGVLTRALARDPATRYETMAAFVHDLRRAARVAEGHESADVDGDATITMPLIMQQEIAGPRLFIATSGVVLAIPLLDEVVVGRKDPAQRQSPDLDLEPYGAGSAGVSRQHARLLRRSDGWYIADLRSTNGTYLNEVRLLPHRPVRVRPGDLVRLAQMTLVFEEA